MYDYVKASDDTKVLPERMIVLAKELQDAVKCLAGSCCRRKDKQVLASKAQVFGIENKSCAIKSKRKV